jgi:hypothetical protein
MVLTSAAKERAMGRNSSLVKSSSSSLLESADEKVKEGAMVRWVQNLARVGRMAGVEARARACEGRVMMMDAYRNSSDM